MYVCLCKGITDKQILEAISSKKTPINPKEILKSLGVGSDCGTCLEEVIKEISQNFSAKSQSMIDYPNKS